MADRRDVVIAGAGPAGSTAAILLARQGARVTLIDKARFPREKLCGEFVSPEAVRILDRAGVLSSLVGASGRATDVLLTDASASSARFPIPHARASGQEALGIPRKEMDSALLEAAASAGAEVIENFEVRQPIVSDGRAAGVAGCERGSLRELRVGARFLVAADGRHSTLARALDAGRRRPSTGGMFGVKAHYRNVREIDGAVELHYFAGGYVGIHAVGRGLVNVCALIDRSVARDAPRDLEAIVRRVFFSNEAARRRLEGAERVTEWLAVGALTFRTEAAVRAGALFLGDAAGTIDPFAGEGMSMALRSAEIAAEEIARSLGLGNEVSYTENHASSGEACPHTSGVLETPWDRPFPIGLARRWDHREWRTAQTGTNHEARPPSSFGIGGYESVAAAYAARWRREFARRIAISRTIGWLAIRPWFQSRTIALIRAFPAAGTVLARGTRAGALLAAAPH